MKNIKIRGAAIGVFVYATLVAYNVIMYDQNVFELVDSITSTAFVSSFIIAGFLSGLIIEYYLLEKCNKIGKTLCILLTILVAPLSFYCAVVLSPIGVSLGRMIDTMLGTSRFGLIIGMGFIVNLTIMSIEVFAALIGFSINTIVSKKTL